MAFTFINRLLTSDEDLKECFGATLSRTLLENGYGENGEMLQEGEGDNNIDMKDSISIDMEESISIDMEDSIPRPCVPL